MSEEELVENCATLEEEKSDNFKRLEKLHFTCNICDKEFRSKENFKRHSNIHNGSKPFICDLCGSGLSSAEALTEHKLIHTDEWPFSCKRCGKSFRFRTNLKRHELAVHAKEAIFKCRICGKKFKLQEYLNTHMKWHDDEKPHGCDLCEKSFTSRTNLNRHKSVHGESKRFVCKVCGVSFKDGSSMRRHEKEHSDSKPFLCLLCGAAFKRAAALNCHLNKKHANEKDKVSVTKGKNNALQFVFNADLGTADSKTSDLIDVLNASSSPDTNLNDSRLCKLAIEHGTRDSKVIIVSQDNRSVNFFLAKTDSSTKQATDENSSSSSCVTDCLGIESSFDKDRLRNLDEYYPDDLTTNHTSIRVFNYEDVKNVGVIDHVEANDDAKSCNDGAIPQQEVVSVITSIDADGRNSVLNDRSSLHEYQRLDGHVVDELEENFAAQPEFNSSDYYDWLLRFSSLCQQLSLPISSTVFAKISEVHKTLTDTLALQPHKTSINKENFKLLMLTATDLHNVINKHLMYILENIDLVNQT